MFTLFPIVLIALSVCVVLTPLVRDFFAFLGLMDQPDFKRKAHSRPIPRVGGLALAFAYLVALMAVPLDWRRGVFDVHDPTMQLIVKLLPALVVIFITGLYDDLWGLSPWRKLAGQTFAALYACWIGIHLSVSVESPTRTILIYLASTFWLVLCANAFNLIDGLDGLAAGVAAIAAVGILVAALVHHNPGLALVISPLIGALLGFLYYNFNRASIFLGDCGSLLVGFLLGCYGLIWNQQATSSFGRVAPLIALGFPVFEVALSVVRRFLRNRPIFGSDSDHIHHRLLSLGLSHRNAALVLYGVSALLASLAVLQTILRLELVTVMLVLLSAIAYAGLRSLRYTEFGALESLLFAGHIRNTLGLMIYLREFDASLVDATSAEECWSALGKICREMKFSYICLTLGKQTYEMNIESATSDSMRCLRVGLSGFGSATFEYDPASSEPAMLIGPLTERLQNKLTSLENTLEPLEDEAISKQILKANAVGAR